MVRDAAMQDMEIDTCVGTPQMDRTSDVMTVQLLSPCQLALESLRIVEVPDRVRGQPRTMIAAGAKVDQPWATFLSVREMECDVQGRRHTAQN